MSIFYSQKQMIEALVVLAEECAEVIQAVTKIQRFGMETVNPLNNISNIESLTTECGDLSAMLLLIRRMGIIDQDPMLRAAEAKMEKLKIYSPNLFKDPES